MKKTVLALIVSAAGVSGLAHASNADVNNFFTAARLSGTNHVAYKMAQVRYTELNARDKMVVDQTYAKAGVSASVMGDITGNDKGAHAAPEGWEKWKTSLQINNSRLSEIHASPVVYNLPQDLAKLHADYPTKSPEALKHEQFLERSREAQNRMRAQEQHVDYNAQVVAAHDNAVYQINAEKAAIQANLDHMQAVNVQVGADKVTDNQTRTETQIIAGNAAHMQAVNDQVGADKVGENQARTQPQVDALNHMNGLAKMVDNVDRTHGQQVALMQAQEVSRTASQHVNTDQVAGDSRLNSMKVDYNAVVVAAHDRQAEEVTQGLNLKRDNLERTASQHVDPAVAAAADTSASDAHIADIQGIDATLTKHDTVIAGNHADIQTLGTTTDKIQTAVAGNHTDIQTLGTTTDKIQTAVAGNHADIQTLGTTTDKIQTAVAGNHADIQTLGTTTDKIQTAVAVNHADISGLAARAADTDARIAETKAEQAKTNERVSANSAAIADHENRIESLESETTSKFSSLKNKVEENRKRASAGIAGVAAMANIPQVTDTQNFSVGAGVGNTDSESALAVGMSARASENVVVKTSVSNDTQHNFVVGAGVSYGW